MWTVESEITEALSILDLSNEELIKCSFSLSRQIQEKAMQTYVLGNPRSWWMAINKKYIAYEYDFPSDHIVEHIPNQDERVWWIPETESEDLQVYDVKPEVISLIMEKTAQFEYYVLGKDYSWLMIETDHCELWVIQNNCDL